MPIMYWGYTSISDKLPIMYRGYTSEADKLIVLLKLD